jgi:hypothetical protein
MPPDYTRHARERMAYYRVDEEEVEAVLRERTWTLPGSGRSRVLAALVGGRALAVVVAPGPWPPRVLTVYLLRGRRTP